LFIISGTGQVTDNDYTAFVEERRLNSDFGQQMIQRVTALIGNANITDHFRQYILNQFRRGLENGTESYSRAEVDTETNVTFLDTELFFFLDRRRPGSGGIFDPQRAATLERIALMKTARMTQGFQHGAEKLGFSGKGMELIQQEVEHRWEVIRDWREQINRRYGDEFSIASE
jgi:hypothetical protein